MRPPPALELSNMWKKNTQASEKANRKSINLEGIIIRYFAPNNLRAVVCSELELISLNDPEIKEE